MLRDVLRERLPDVLPETLPTNGPAGVSADAGDAEVSVVVQVGAERIADIAHAGSCRSATTRSRIRSATAVFACSGTGTSPSRPRIVTALVSCSKPAPGCVTSLATTR